VLLASRFARLRPATRKLASFRAAKGWNVELALERSGDIFIWAEAWAGGIEGVEINNAKRPGQPYAPDQLRSSAVNSQCANHAVGNQAWYLRCSTIGALERFADWYGTV
jgi:hypothetical protein